MENFPSNLKWYQTTPGMIFLGVLAILFAGALFIASLTGYYLYQLKFGDSEKLAETFSDQFTVDPNRLNNGDSSKFVPDFEKYIYDTTPIRGNPEAPVTIIEVIDFQCPFCQKSYPIFKQMIEKYGSAIKIAFKHLPVEVLHPEAYNAHVASTCAQEQNKFWEYYDELFIRKTLDEKSLYKIASDLQIDLTQFNTCYEEKKYSINIEKDLYDATALNIIGTPTYIVNGIKYEGVISPEKWDNIILDSINQK